MQKERNKKKLTRRGRRAGARVQRDRPWRRLREALLDHLCRRHDTARDPPSCTRSARGTSRAAFFFVFVGNLENPIFGDRLASTLRSSLLFFFRRLCVCGVPPWKERERESERKSVRISFYFYFYFK